MELSCPCEILISNNGMAAVKAILSMRRPTQSFLGRCGLLKSKAPKPQTLHTLDELHKPISHCPDCRALLGVLGAVWLDIVPKP